MNFFPLSPVDPLNPDPRLIARATEALRRGALVAFPTETVYGLGANALDARAVRRIFEAKGRPQDNPVIVHVASPDDVPRLAEVTDVAQMLMRAFWPGPLTLVLVSKPVVPLETRAGLPTVAVRMPSHAVAHALIAACGFPLAAPSANRSGRPSPTEAEAVWDDLGDRVEMILDAGPTAIGLESTVLDASVPGVLTLLRAGGATAEAIRDVIGNRVELQMAAHGGEAHRSPGTRYRHYAPNVPLLLWEGERFPAIGEKRWAYVGVRRPVFSDGLVRERRAKSFEEYAAMLFSALRELESSGVDCIVADWPQEESGIARALCDRLRRAAGG